MEGENAEQGSPAEWHGMWVLLGTLSLGTHPGTLPRQNLAVLCASVPGSFSLQILFEIPDEMEQAHQTPSAWVGRSL